MLNLTVPALVFILYSIALATKIDLLTMLTPLVKNLGKPEVDDFQVRRIVFRLEQEILWLQVPVAHAVVMAVVDGLEDLLEDLGCVLF